MQKLCYNLYTMKNKEKSEMNYCTVSFDKNFLEKVKAMKQNKLNVDLTNSYYNDNDIVDEHDAEPIKSKDDINRICMYLLKEKRYRDYCLFIIGINTGLRIYDILHLSVGDLVNEDGTFKDEMILMEHKTKNTRKTKVNRHISINNSIKKAVKILLDNGNYSLNDYLFTSNSNRCTYEYKSGIKVKSPLKRQSVDFIFKGIAKDLNLNFRFATHSLRKTFGYNVIKMNQDNPRSLQLLQKIFNHSSPSITLRYVGITSDEINKTYNDLNLGI